MLKYFINLNNESWKRPIIAFFLGKHIKELSKLFNNHSSLHVVKKKSYFIFQRLDLTRRIHQIGLILVTGVLLKQKQETVVKMSS